MARIETPKRVRGTQDIFGEEQRRFARVVEAFEHVRRLYCFQQVQVPVFESTGVFARSMGETSDVVSKEMYTFPDRGDDLLTLRPEFTAGICRAYITEGWQQFAPLKLTTHGPVFRYERPQKGRYRQFHQIDAEIIGAAEPAADVELLTFADQLLRELGIGEGVTLQLNTLGDAETRDAWRAALIEHFQSHRGDLSEDSLTRLEKNPLRILDSKDPRDRPAADSAPDIDAFLTTEAKDFFDAVTGGLDAAGVAWTRNARLVRGLDYYRHTAFEFVTDRLGAQGTVLAGGRYDGLIGNLGGPETPGVGWAAGIERLGMLLEAPAVEQVQVAVVVERAGLEAKGIELVASLRRAGVVAELFATGSPKKRYDKAVKSSPAEIVSIDVRDDAPVVNRRTLKSEAVDDEMRATLIAVLAAV
ncbi:histidine--tRNA ligase [Sphingomonas koreensis]|jgi:histidyl-tRNA synthetase|uniref:Histidine--tRNA ligase n=1 Tax=Sphingomonas koreensis TaxID=93064 RepID=A0A1L6J8D6_9SPHN|nr:histidine--tRNA ligase [Sphingomonas koreensis]APR52231.1 histidine--tRNA ligase [Sphingomonas koreensis]MDC7812979.1 histidine--tRNA ligase [Sphingomonas koreensis]RSU17152.1 histidine--tRNA ligase [Sphingomonas koreensis]RSU19451.1 histidine--tRNA ligase [Sphingomonas koreensis]RSU20697.1 histidine--tRNA ligase [Sphingomonas koreensis]